MYCKFIDIQGRTRAYSRRGEKLVEFNSALPGGNVDEQIKRCTLLDCIWVAKEKAYYVLDVLAWSNQPLLNCDVIKFFFSQLLKHQFIFISNKYFIFKFQAEFRHFWLRSKLEEATELRQQNTRQNKYSILPLPNVSCDDDLTDFLQTLPPLPPLDGLLFYHRDGEYMGGTTPLVTWLKPFMLPEVLGVFVPSPLDEKPDGYVDFRNHILSKKYKRKEKTGNGSFDQSVCC